MSRVTETDDEIASYDAPCALKRPLLPHIGRQVQPDAAASAAGCRIDEHLGQWPAQGSREPAMPDPPEADPEAHHRYITLSDWEDQGERALTRRSVRQERAPFGWLRPAIK